MAVSGVCTHEDCIGWCYQQHHQIHGAERLMSTVEQFGVLYTMDGRRYPEEVQPEILDQVNVPRKFAHLKSSVQTEPQPLPEVDLALLAELEDLGTSAEDRYEIVSLGRGVQQRQPKLDRGPQRIGRS